MSFLCPLGLVKTNTKGKEVNCNYYETEALRTSLSSFILRFLRLQLAFGLDTSVCYCIGSGEHYRFLASLNEEHKFFETIVPLEHPRYITQYHPEQKDEYIRKYLACLSR